MALFGNKEEKVAQDQAAQAEVDRLLALPVKELAVELMPALGPDGARPGKQVGILQVAVWLMRDHPRGNKLLKQLLDPIREALQALENAGLVLVKTQSRDVGGFIKLTREGEQALADGNVAQHLQD